jgi:hypothetical protein
LAGPPPQPFRTLFDLNPFSRRIAMTPAIDIPDFRIPSVTRLLRRVILMPRARSTTIVREYRISLPRVSFLETREG